MVVSTTPSPRVRIGPSTQRSMVRLVTLPLIQSRVGLSGRPSAEIWNGEAGGEPNGSSNTSGVEPLPGSSVQQEIVTAPNPRSARCPAR